MQDLCKQGVIKAIGMSNFYPHRLVDLIDHNEVTERTRVAAMDTGASLFFDHRGPEMVSQLGNVRVTTDRPQNAVARSAPARKETAHPA